MKHSTAGPFVPAHKQTNPDHAPGQVVNNLPRDMQKLSDYIKSIVQRDALDQAAQENDPLP